MLYLVIGIAAFVLFSNKASAQETAQTPQSPPKVGGKGVPWNAGIAGGGNPYSTPPMPLPRPPSPAVPQEFVISPIEKVSGGMLYDNPPPIKKIAFQPIATYEPPVYTDRTFGGGKIVVP